MIYLIKTKFNNMKHTMSPKAASTNGLLASLPVLLTSQTVKPFSDLCLSNPAARVYGSTAPQAKVLQDLLCLDVYSLPLKTHESQLLRTDVS